VSEGLEQADAGRLTSHAEVGRLLDARFGAKRGTK
jgi:hypothetical protein